MKDWKESIVKVNQDLDSVLDKSIDKMNNILDKSHENIKNLQDDIHTIHNQIKFITAPLEWTATTTSKLVASKYKKIFFLCGLVSAIVTHQSICMKKLSSRLF